MAMMVKPGAALANQRDRTKPVESKYGMMLAKQKAERAAQLAPGIAAQKAAHAARTAKSQQVASDLKSATERLKASTAKLQQNIAEAKAKRAAKAKPPGMREGGKTESKAMMRKEVAFMKEKGAPKSMIKHEEREAKGYAGGGRLNPSKFGSRMSNAVMMSKRARLASNRTVSDMSKRPKFSEGGGVYRHAADGVTQHGKTKGHMVKMREGGSVGGSYRSAADGVASKGKTKGHMVKMAYGGKC